MEVGSVNDASPLVISVENNSMRISESESTKEDRNGELNSAQEFFFHKSTIMKHVVIATNFENFI